MKRILAVAALLWLGACATTANRQQDLVQRALQAVGGAEAATRMSALYQKVEVKHWEPEQSIVPDGEARPAGESTLELTRDLRTGAARADWVRNLVYPGTRQYKFSEIVTPAAGYVIGIDSSARNKQSQESKPPAHAMSGQRLAAAQRELARTSPRLLLDMRDHPERVSARPDVRVGEVSYPAVNYRAGDYSFTVLFDPQTALPARIRSLDYDNIWGDSTYDLVLSEWKTVDGLRLPTRQEYQLNGQTVADYRIVENRVLPGVLPENLEIPAAVLAGAAKPATGNVPYQWVLRRQHIGVYLDSEALSYDARATSGLRLVDVAPGVAMTGGGSHNSLIVEMADHLIVLDAPVSDAQSSWTLAALREKYPGKPVKYLALTHHHMDHAGGLRAYVAQGATLVVGKGAGEHFRRVLSRPYTRNSDLPARDLSATPIVEVADRHVLSDGRREVQLYLIPNPHAESTLMGYVVDARLGFVADLWSPGRDALGEKLNPGQQAVVVQVRRAGIQPLRFAGGHGSVGDYAPLEALAGK